MTWANPMIRDVKIKVTQNDPKNTSMNIAGHDSPLHAIFNDFLTRGRVRLFEPTGLALVLVVGLTSSFRGCYMEHCFSVATTSSL